MKTRIKKTLLAAVLCCVRLTVMAQNASQEPISWQKQTIKILVQDPQFPGGQKALFSFLSKQMKYPAKALASKKEAKVVLKFLVMEDGNISNISPLSKDNDGFAEEAMRIIKQMPK